MTATPKILFEACVETLAEATRAEQQGAHRLELCTDLHLDGLTPDAALIKTVLSHVHIPIKVMIRPRGGDFVYSDDEFTQMLDSIQECKGLGISEIVTGILRADNTIDTNRLARLCEAAHPMTITIHKCIDEVPDVFVAIEQLKTIHGVTAILSSGQAPTAEHGADLLRKMVEACGDDLILVVAGKVTQANLEVLVLATGASEYHGRRIV